VIHVSEINKVISEADAEGLDSFFLEVLSKPGVRTTTLGLCFLGCEKLNVFFMLSLDNIKSLIILYYQVTLQTIKYPNPKIEPSKPQTHNQNQKNAPHSNPAFSKTLTKS
jgi:hypothetical protein